jgi:hypothetical protein
LGGESACADRAKNLLRGRHVASLLFGEHQLAVGKYVQHTASAQAQLNLFYPWPIFQFTFQAPGLSANVGSKKTALNLNFH